MAVGARLHTTHTYTVYSVHVHQCSVMWLHTRQHDDITFDAVAEEMKIMSSCPLASHCECMLLNS